MLYTTRLQSFSSMLSTTRLKKKHDNYPAMIKIKPCSIEYILYILIEMCTTYLGNLPWYRGE